MAPRANWKGFLRLALVTCTVALDPATSESEKISFNQLNRATGHRVKYLKVDADTGDEVPNEDIVKGYQLEKDQFIEVTKEELEESALESTCHLACNIAGQMTALMLESPYHSVAPGTFRSIFNRPQETLPCCRSHR